MMPRATPVLAGNVRSVAYHFDAAGDTLPMHGHTPETEHLTAVLQGEVICRGPGSPPAWECRIPAPEIHDLPAGAHEIEAAQDHTVIWNVTKGVP